MSSLYPPSPTATSRPQSPAPSPPRAESLVAHPLLASPAPSSPAPPGSQLTPPHYLPYTPRQRPQLATTSGGASANATVSQPNYQQQADATRRLQMTNLQSAVQVYSVESHSIGWALLEWLVEGGNESIWNAINDSKAVVLLPLERQEREKITIDFVKDHVAYVYGTELVTLSGLRGTLKENTLTISSSLHPTSTFFTAIASPSNRQADTISLPPLPPLHTEHPQYAVPSYIPSLPLPYPRLIIPPPLPLRPSTAINPTHSRISNPFASLFGGTGKRQASTSIPPRSASPSPSINSLDIPDPHPQLTHISAYTVTKRILRTQAGSALDSALSQAVQLSLSPLGNETPDEIDKWVLENVLDFVKHWAPLVKIDKDKDSIVVGRPKNKTVDYVVNDAWSKDAEALGMEDTGRRVQAFMEEVEGGVRALLAITEEEKGVEECDKRVIESLERVETLLCTLFYDRLFSPMQDVEHDKVLQERVNISKDTVGLDELGVRVDALSSTDGSILEDNSVGVQVVREVTNLCGAVLARLNQPGCSSPGVKARTLVEAHKVLVEGLSNLPAVRISAKAETEMTGSTELKTLDPPKPEPSSDPLLSPAEKRHTESPTSLSPLVVTKLSLPPAAPAPSPLSSDLLLPLLIYTILNAFPPRLLAHLLFVQRFRCPALSTGEEAFCLVNLLAGAEYLMQLHGTKDGHPPTPPSPLQPALPGTSPVRASFIVDALTGSANKMINGVVDSSFGILKSFSLLTPSSTPIALPADEDTSSNTQANAKMGLGMLRKESGLSLRALTASLPGRSHAPSVLDTEGGRPLLVVNSRPNSVREDSSDEESGDEEEDEGEDSEEGEEDEDEEEDAPEHDARSIKSFESMMSERGGRRGKRIRPKQRKSLSDRLANVSGSVGNAVKSLKPGRVNESVYPPPNARFMECVEGDLRLSEVAELLDEYRKLVRAVKANGGYAA